MQQPDTDVVEESFGLLLALELSSANLPVIVYDPSAEARALNVYKNIRVAPSAQECIAESRVVVLATPWQEFRDLRPALWARPGYSGVCRHRLASTGQGCPPAWTAGDS